MKCRLGRRMVVGRCPVAKVVGSRGRGGFEHGPMEGGDVDGTRFRYPNRFPSGQDSDA